LQYGAMGYPLDGGANDALGYFLDGGGNEDK